MTDSAVDVTTFTRQIEIRLRQPVPNVKYVKGKPVKEAVPDMEKLADAIREEVTHNLQTAFGPQTEVRISVGKVNDIRLNGTFEGKVEELKTLIGEVVADAFDNVDLSGE